MNNRMFIIFAALGLLVFFNHMRQEKQKSEQAAIVEKAIQRGAGGVELESLGIPLSCQGKKYCITVFIAPWCGACAASEPTFMMMHKFLAEQKGDIGFGLVIGADQPEANQKKKEQLSPIASYTDDEGHIMKRRSINSFPTWVTTNDSGKEIFRKSGGFRVTDPRGMPQFLSMLTSQ